MKKTICILLTLMVLLCACACEKNSVDEQSFAPFVYRGTEICPDAEAASIISALGEYIAFAETNSCYGDGKDKVYQYTSFKLTTYSSKGKDYVLSIELFNDVDEDVCTKEGIRVGASASDVIAAYGEASTHTDSAIVYENTAAKTRLQFLLRDGKVTNIQYLKSEG